MTGVGLAAALLSALFYQCSGRPPSPLAAPANTEFDFYLLSLSLAPAFCADGHQHTRECQALDAQSFAATPLTLHGLWPENRDPNTYPRHCANRALQLDETTRAALRRWMPGGADGLVAHEWRTHGVCTDLTAEDYFKAAIRWTSQVDVALGPAIRQAAGGSLDAATLRATAQAKLSGLGESMVFVCKNLPNLPPDRRRPAHLAELRLCLSADGADGAPGQLLNCANMRRRDQGCGDRFLIDAPHGAGNEAQRALQ